MRLQNLALTAFLFTSGCQTSPVDTPKPTKAPGIALQIALRGLDHPPNIKVVVDTFDIPHVLADTNRGAYFAQGFLHAYFRMWQMEFRARMAEGTSGLLTVGSLTNDDQFAQKAELLAAALKIESEILKDPEMNIAATAYCEGVNARIRQLDAQTTPEQYRQRGLQPRPWTPLQIALSIVSSTWGQARPADELRLDAIKKSVSEQDFQQFFPLHGNSKITSAIRSNKEHRQYTLALDRLQSSLDTGSNAFSIHGSRTATGKPIVANDFHLDYIVPTLLLPMQLVADRFNVFGATSIGIPGVMSGTNRHLAWTVVNSMADTTDWFRLKFRNRSKQEYRWNGKWRRVVSRIRETTLNDGKIARVEIRTTEAGPLLPVDSNGDELALSWIGASGKTTFLPFVRLPQMERADACGNDALLASLSHVVLTCADRTNSIGEWWGGMIPRREKNHDPRIVTDAESSQQVWRTYTLAGRKVHKTNVTDYSVNANSAPDRVGNSLSLYLGWEFSPPFRRNRIVDLLKSKAMLRASEVIHIQSDIIDYRHRELVNLLPLAFKQNSDNGSCEKGLALNLKNWDGTYNVDSLRAPLFQSFIAAVEHRLVPSTIGVFGEQLGSVRLALFEILRSGLITEKREVIEAVRLSATETCQFGTKRQAWGKINPVQLRTFGAADTAKSEELEAPGATSTVFSQGRVRGTVWRMVTQLDERPSIWFSSIGQLESGVGQVANSQWTQRWSKQEMTEIRFFEPSDFSLQ